MEFGLAREFLQQIANGVVMGGSYALLGMGLTLIYGIMDVLNFAHGEFYMLGGLLVYFLTVKLGVGFGAAIIAAVVISYLIGMLLERFLIRRVVGEEVTTSAMVCIGLSLVISNCALFVMGPIPQSIPSPFSIEPLRLGPILLTEARLFALVLAIAVLLGTQVLLRRSKLGRAMRAAFEDKDAARLVGVSVYSVYRLTFAYGTALAAIAGCLLSVVYVVSPFMGELVGLKAWTVVIMGGIGNTAGAVAGGMLLGIAEALGAGFVTTEYKDAIAMIIVILVLLFRPQGILSSKKA